MARCPAAAASRPGGVDRTVAELLAEASNHFAAADEALRRGDLATYQDEIEAAQDLVAEALGSRARRQAERRSHPSASPSP